VVLQIGIVEALKRRGFCATSPSVSMVYPCFPLSFKNQQQNLEIIWVLQQQKNILKKKDKNGL
jgi:hypothetical protein